MNTEIKEKWLESLRSGKYEQGTGALRKNGEACDQFCCLGVLCDIIAPEKWKLANKSEIFIHDCDRVGTLSSRLKEKVGLNADIEEQLIDLNDNGKSFSEIADFIQEHV